MLESVISIDTEKEIIHLYSRPGGGAEMMPVVPSKNGEPQEERKINYHVVSYKAEPFSEDFFNKFKELIKKYREDFPSVPMQRVSLILPDSACLMDTVNIPVMQKRMMENSLSAALVNLYKNSAEFKFNRYIALQSKHQATYGVAGFKREVLSNFNINCAALQIGVANVTFASNAAVDGAMGLNPKLKNASFVLLDINDFTTKIIIVIKGKTMGSYKLPFGYTMLVDNMMIPEDLLFNYANGEAEVADAKERAKAKNATDKKRARQEVVDDDVADDDEVDEDEDNTERGYMADGAERPAFLDTDRVARKLPGYMLRDIPESREGFVYENFRIFMKWTLEVLAANTAISSLDTIEKVYVNMPEQLGFLYDMVNSEAEESGVSFEPLCEKQGDEMIHRYLELFGGFFVKHYNKMNNF